ncbi:VHS-domain-containing protein, partial [Gymnopus androsaceus JB14]
MSLLGNWLWGNSQLDEAIDKATSELLPAGSEDIALNLEICDQIRSKSVPAKDAMRALKRRLNHKNPNVQLLVLGLTDICVKNGGDHFLAEIGSREFVKPSLGYVSQTCKTLQNEGFKFPPKDLTAANSLMVDTQTAPEWIDSDHHCRNCGQVYDQACSSKTMALPHFGITQEVRVCDTCYNKMNKRAERGDKGPGHRHSASLHSGRHRSARDLADAELQRAIQLSLQEVGAAGGHARPGFVPEQPSSYRYSEPPIIDRTTHPSKDEEEDPDLKAAIEASLREANAPKPSAPIVVETPRSEQPVYSGPGYSQSYPPGVVPPHPALPNIPNYDLEPLETDAILTFSQTVEQVQAQGGRDMSRYPAVNELYEKANSLRPKLAMNVDDTGRKEQLLSEMHDQLSQAVKLYDQLLSQQVAQPRWRSPEPAAPYQGAHMGYAPPTNGYAQWAPPNGYPAQTSAPNGYPAPAQTSAPQPQPQPSYFPPQEVHTPTQQSQSQWYPQQQSAMHQAPSAPSASYASSSQSTYQASSPTPVPQAPSPQQYSAPAPVQQFSYPASSPTPTPSSPQQYSAPAPFSYAGSTPKPVPFSVPQQQYSPPAPPIQSSPTLSRQNTISYVPSATPQPATSSLARSHSLAHPSRSTPQQSYYPSQPYANQPPPQQQPQQLQQQQHYYAPSAPPAAAPGPSVSLSQFP